MLCLGKLPVQDASNIKEGKVQHTDMSRLKTSRDEQLPTGNRTQGDEKVQPVRVEKKVGRNDPCPCGSGKKYKQCHGKDVEN